MHSDRTQAINRVTLSCPTKETAVTSFSGYGSFGDATTNYIRDFAAQDDSNWEDRLHIKRCPRPTVRKCKATWARPSSEATVDCNETLNQELRFD
jgi:hypothetical protein